MSNDEITVLITGDTHIPTRAKEIPKIMLSEIKRRGLYDYLLFTGDLVSNEVLDTISEWANKVYVVRGNMDYLNLPNQVILNIDKLRFGLIHGHQVYPRGDTLKLSRIAAKLQTDILVSGHTHNPFIKEVNVRGSKVLLINPGSLTGVWSGGFASMKPAFMIAYIKDREIVVELYELSYKLIRKRYEFTV